MQTALRRSAQFLIMFAGLIWLAACSGGDSTVVIVSGDAGHRFTVEIADDPTARNRGLMFRQSMSDDQGMLFDFKEERPVSFWMRNTFIPLDMIFATKDGAITQIHQNARPHDDTSIPSETDVQFVLEINGGLAAELGIEVGDQLVHPRVSSGAE